MKWTFFLTFMCYFVEFDAMYEKHQFRYRQALNADSDNDDKVDVMGSSG